MRLDTHIIRNQFSENFLLAKRAKKRHDRPMTKHSPFEQTIASFLRELEGGNKSPLTLIAYKTDLTQFFQWLAENDVTVTACGEVTRGHVKRPSRKLCKGVQEKGRYESKQRIP